MPIKKYNKKDKTKKKTYKLKPKVKKAGLN